MALLAGPAALGHPELTVPADNQPLQTVPAPAVYAATAGQQALTNWAIGRFGAAGLELPPLEVTFYDDRADCGGNHGSFGNRGDLAVIKICTPRPHVVLHELAHAWEAENVSVTARKRFMDELALSSWTGAEVPWSDRGTERAANTIALVLDWESHQITDERALSRLCGYEILTGESLPDAIPADCEGDGETPGLR